VRAYFQGPTNEVLLEICERVTVLRKPSARGREAFFLPTNLGCLRRHDPYMRTRAEGRLAHRLHRNHFDRLNESRQSGVLAAATIRAHSGIRIGDEINNPQRRDRIILSQSNSAYLNPALLLMRTSETRILKRKVFMRHHRAVILRGAIALTPVFIAATGAAASAASPWGANARPSTTTLGAAGRLQSVAASATVHKVTTLVNGTSETILVDAGGLPLYYHQGDTAKKSQVSGALLRAWPALMSANPTGTGTVGKLSSVKGVNGGQVAYNGHLLYTFINDTAGDVTGQGVSDFFVATPHLTSLHSSTATATATHSAGGGYGY
jgi:predicted lipoprotein with Yx(FWY)xxD motif